MRPAPAETIYATALADYSAGMHLVQGILLALLQRERTGVGQSSRCRCMNPCWPCRCRKPRCGCSVSASFSWGSLPLTGVFATTDGAIVIVGAFKANPLQDISSALGLPDLSVDPNYATFASRSENKAKLHRLFRSGLSTNTTAHWLARLEEQDLLCSPVPIWARRWPPNKPRPTTWWCRSSNGGARDGATNRSLVGSPVP